MSMPAGRVLLNRLTFGAAPEELIRLNHVGTEVWLREQLTPDPHDEPDITQRLAAVKLRLKYAAGEGYGARDELVPLKYVNSTVSDLWPLTDNKRPMAGAERQRPRQEMAAAAMVRAMYSRWQVREVLVDFWHNHFNVNAGGDHAIAAALPDYDRAIRSHALGNFREMLEAVATSPAMLIYLNNRTSRAGTANENYGRELFELHTLGREAYLNELYNRWRDVPGAAQSQPSGYIDQDVYEAARAFTGWAIEDGAGLGGGQTLPATGRFTYVEGWHDSYQKRVLAAEFEPFQPPLADGRKVLDLVAFHPATARFVCTKLCRRLVSDTPPDAVIKSAMQVWTATAHRPDQIAQVVTAIALHPAMTDGFGGKVKRPLELAASFVRATGMDITVTDGLLNELDGSGQKLFGWSLPTGHPDTMEYWLSSHVLRRRWSLVAGLADNWWGTGAFAPSSRLTRPIRADAAAALWHADLTGSEADPTTIAAILTGIKLPGDTVLDPNPGKDYLHRRILALCALGPAFNLR